VLAAIPGIARTLRDPATLPEGMPLARVHGDYHLGQVLRSSTGSGWTIVDFEGEPQRSLSARRQKSSPLRDVATMLRSFDYAVTASMREGGRARPTDAAREAARTWHDQVRAAYLETYLDEVSRASPPIVPEDPAQRARTLRFFEVEKALRELLYEIDHRPTWIDIPLSALARMSGEP
jgi:trehalose synthase-fused probable maltokinase